MIVPDGYNVGRDWFVKKATAGSYWEGVWWKADVEWRKGLLEPGKHGEQSRCGLVKSHTYPGVNHGIAQDGIVAILTIRRL